MKKPHLDKILEELNIRTTDGEPVTPNTSNKSNREGNLSEMMKASGGDFDKFLELMMDKTSLKFYILEDKKPKLVSFKDHRDWFMSNDPHLFRDEIGDIEISTVFLPLDPKLSFGDGEPRIFETIVFGGEYDSRTKRYTTYEDAEIGHKNLCDTVRKEQN